MQQQQQYAHDESSSDTVDSRDAYYQQLQSFVYDSTHESMPSLYTDDDDWDDTSIESTDEINMVFDPTSHSHGIESTDEINSNIHIRSHEEKIETSIFHQNNIHFVCDNNKSTIKIGESAYYPPNLDTSITAGAVNENNNKYTNVHYKNGMVTDKNINIDNS